MFETTETYPLPNKDILSYLFDDPKYDQNQPVGSGSLSEALNLLTSSRFMSMHTTPSAAYHVNKLAASFVI